MSLPPIALAPERAALAASASAPPRPADEEAALQIGERERELGRLERAPGRAACIGYAVGVRLALTSSLRLFASGLAVGGCYASHERPTTWAAGCRSPEPACVGPVAMTEGVCVEAGEVFAFAEGDHAVSCTAEDGDVTRLARLVSCAEPRTRARTVACCAPSEEAFITRWLFGGVLVGTTLEVEESDEGCWALPDDPYPIAPFLPWAPAELCDDPLGWSGVPIVFSVRTPGVDPCAGGVSHAELCRARVEGYRIVVELSIAPAEVRGCDRGVSDDEARCAVLPLPAGAYEVVDERGRALGRIDVAAAPPRARAATCVPIGG